MTAVGTIMMFWVWAVRRFLLKCFLVYKAGWVACISVLLESLIKIPYYV
jgi:hypothetical protein